MIPGYGMGNALELHMQDKMGGDINEFFTTTQQYLGVLNQRPELHGLSSQSPSGAEDIYSTAHSWLDIDIKCSSIFISTGQAREQRPHPVQPVSCIRSGI